MAFRILTLALAAVLPLTLSTAIEDVFFGAWRMAQWAFTGAALVLAGALLAGGRTRAPRDPATIAWGLFALWVLAGAGWSVNPWDGLRRALELSGAVAAYWLGRRHAARFGELRLAVLASAGLCSVYALSQAAGFDPLPWSTRFGARGFGTLGNPDYYAGHLLLVIPLLAAGPVPSWPMAAMVGGALAGGFIVSQVRGAWIAAAAAAAWAAAAVWRAGGLDAGERKATLRAAVAGGLLLVLAMVSIPGLGSRLGSIASIGGYDATGRRYLWAVAIRIFEERPVMGHGTGAFKFAFPRHQIEGQQFHLNQFRPYNYSEHAHSELLQLGAELGLIGIVLFLAGMGLWLAGWLRAVNSAAAQQNRDVWRTQLGIGVALAGSFAYSWVNFPLQIVPTATLWWLLVGASDGLRRQEPDGRTLPAWASRTVGVLLIVLGLAGAFVVASDLPGNGYLKHTRLRLEMDDTRSARMFGEAARRAAPHDFRVWRWLSRMSIKAADETLLEESVAMRRRLHPDLADALSDRADYSRHQGRRDEALERYQAVLAEAPNFVSAWSQIGTIRFERGEYQLAAESFQRGIYYQDGNAELWHNLAATYGTMKQYRLALEADQAAVARDPNFYEAYIGIGLSALKLRDKPTALRAAEQAYRLNPNDSRAASLIRQAQ